jgi:hypothetical protein
MTKRRHTVTDIVGAVYCERKAVFDRQYGKASTPEVRRKAEQGTFEHRRFEVEGYTRNPIRFLAKIATGNPRPRYRSRDSRCFIASQVYGVSAVETDALRAWRDAVLMPKRAGRAFVAAYYATSPALVHILKRSPRLARWARRCLDAIVRRIGGAA